jgi:hypothetical protein
MKQEQYIYVDEDGNKFYYKDRAMTIRHRLDGPAIDYNTSGSKVWFVNGKLHRLNGPAVEWADGSNLWYVDGKLHRLDGPAIKWANGSGEWFVSSKRHRLDGPAVEWANGSKEWWIDGKYLTEDQFNALTALTIELTLEDIAAKFGVDVGKLKIVK